MKANQLPTGIILVVDDDQDILGLAAEILDVLGYEVLTVRSGLEALAMLQDNSRISVLFTDIQMPGMVGKELAEIAVALRPNLQVIFASGSTRPNANIPFVPKPYKTADLVRVLPRLL
jgi:CheY-like chemotaxis protein